MSSRAKQTILWTAEKHGTVNDAPCVIKPLQTAGSRDPLRRAGDQHRNPVATRVVRGAAIGSGAMILCGLTLGANALIGAGAVVTAGEGAVVAGSPARFLRWRTS